MISRDSAMRQNACRSSLVGSFSFISWRMAASLSIQSPKAGGKACSSCSRKLREKAGLRPPVPMVSRKRPRRMLAGTKKSESPGSSATLTSACAARASSAAMRLTSRLSAVQKTRNGRTRCKNPASYGWASQKKHPVEAS